jgi:hypothetical protein
MYSEGNIKKFDLDGEYQRAIDEQIAQSNVPDEFGEIDRWITPEEDLVPMWPPHNISQHLPNEIQIKIRKLLVKSVENTIDRQKYTIRQAKYNDILTLHVYNLSKIYRELQTNESSFVEFLFGDNFTQLDVHVLFDWN